MLRSRFFGLMFSVCWQFVVLCEDAAILCKLHMALSRAQRAQKQEDSNHAMRAVRFIDVNKQHLDS